MITRGRSLLAVFISMLALAAPAHAAAPPPEYVSLGDSYAAGPLIPLQIPPFGCSSRTTTIRISPPATSASR